MPTKQSNKKSIRNGIIYDIVTSVGSTVTALLYEPAKEKAQKAATQYRTRQKQNNSKS